MAVLISGVVCSGLSAGAFATIQVIVRKIKDVHHSLVASFQSTGNFVLSLIGLLLYRLVVNPNGFEYNFTFIEVLLLALSGLVRSLS